MLIGYFDYIVFGTLTLFNVFLWNKKPKRCIGCLISGILFGIVLPFISMKIEIIKVRSEHEALDGYELLYTTLRFPMYWFFGIVQAVLFYVYRKHK